jgi:hypothetical protein
MNGCNVKALVFIIGLLLAMLFVYPEPSLAQPNSIGDGYPESLQEELKVWLARKDRHPDDPDVHYRLAGIYLNLGDDWYEDRQDRIQAYEQGAAEAKKLWQTRPDHAEGHYLYAANLGSLSHVKGLAYGAKTINEIIRHLEWTLELNPDHAQALQFLGGLLAELPWLLGGNKDQAQAYLEKAIHIDGNYTNARILLAKLLIKQNRIAEARQQLTAVVQAQHPHYPYTWAKTFRPLAQSMLDNLKN